MNNSNCRGLFLKDNSYTLLFLVKKNINMKLFWKCLYNSNNNNNSSIDFYLENVWNLLRCIKSRNDSDNVSFINRYEN